MKTDTQIQRDVLDELKWQPQIRDAEIGVAAKDGVVTLTGFVDSFAQKFEAERAAERVCGVRAIADDLKVKLPHTSQRSDTEIAHAALTALKWNIQVPDDQLKVKVEDGWVTLDGHVDLRYQRAAAEDAVRYLIGVKGVINSVVVRQPRPSAFEVSQKIKEALKRSATVDADRISVESKDGRVILRGTVRSWAERYDAESAAWAAPGVATVEDQIAVSV
jgi:osmotically-inducible protein OsmY